MPTRTPKPVPVMTEQQQRDVLLLMEKAKALFEQHYQTSDTEKRVNYGGYRARVDGTLQYVLDVLADCFPEPLATAFQEMARAYDRAWDGKPWDVQ